MPETIIIEQETVIICHGVDPQHHRRVWHNPGRAKLEQKGKWYADWVCPETGKVYTERGADRQCVVDAITRKIVAKHVLRSAEERSRLMRLREQAIRIQVELKDCEARCRQLGITTI